MNVLAQLKKMLISLTTFPYYVILPSNDDRASWHEASALAFYLACIGARHDLMPSGLGVTRVSVNPKASSIEDFGTHYSRTALALEPHTDMTLSNDPHSIVIFGMSRPDEIGGETQIVIVDELLPLLDSQTVELLSLPIWKFGKFSKPIFEFGQSNGDVRVSYYRQQLERSMQLGSGRFSEEQIRALSQLDAACSYLAAKRTFKLKEGETILINNHKLLHGRTALAEKSNRLMFRYRLRVDFSACCDLLYTNNRGKELFAERLMHAVSSLEKTGRTIQAEILKSDKEIFLNSTPSKLAPLTKSDFLPATASGQKTMWF